MNDTSQRFLSAFKASLTNETVAFSDQLSIGEWLKLFEMASMHHVLPMIYDAVYREANLDDEEIRQLFSAMKQQAIQTVTMQTMRTASFLHLYTTLGKKDIHPIIVKGLICRNLYPNPDYRISGDEDLWIDDGEFPMLHESLLQYGMVPADVEKDIWEEFEVPYMKEGTSLYIEVHKQLFPPKSEAYADLNKYFENAEQETITMKVDGVRVRTLDPTNHLFYLVCHAFKHFLHSGFGLRQVSDIVLFTNAYGSSIKWDTIVNQCRVIHAEKFAIALFQIGEKYLIFDSDKACYPDAWKQSNVDETKLLEDLLEGGVFGDSSMTRKHSSNITLGAVAAQNNGKKSKNSLIHSLFPSAVSLEGRYPYLRKHKILLPIAWINRIWNYRKEMKNTGDQSAMESLQIGEKRTELLREYGIID